MTTDEHARDGLSDLDDLLRDDGDSPDRATDPRVRRRRRAIGWTVALIVLALVIGVPGGYVGWALNAPISAPTVTSQTPAAPTPAGVTPALPTEGAAALSVSGGEVYFGEGASGIWASSGGDEARPIASISKLITALVILDAKPLDGPDDPGPTIAFSEADHDLYDEYYVQGATIAAMPRGSSMSQYDALATMLIPSASNYAVAMSTWAFGSQGAFVSAARRWLADNGMNSTSIVEPTGLSTRNVSTPGDLITLGKLAAADPVVARISATPWMDIEGPGVINNTNSLLGTSGITGLKTGNLGPGSHNLLYTATLDIGAEQTLTVTGVSLGGKSGHTVNAGVVRLLDSIRAGFRTVPLATAGDEVGSITTRWGSTARLVIGEDAAIFTWSDIPITVTMQTSPPVTYEDGEAVGSITWTAGPHTATAPIALEGTIEQPDESWRLTHPGELGPLWG